MAKTQEEELQEETAEETLEESPNFIAEEDALDQQAGNEADGDVEKLSRELEDLNQKFLRVAADFENYKRRTISEKEDLVKYSNAKIIGEILPVLDNFQLALKNPGASEEAQNLFKGVEMIYHQLLQVLEHAGMTKIEAVGQPFDPNKHDAVMQVEDGTVEEDTVVEELRAGYMLKERVIRPTMVKVSKK